MLEGIRLWYVNPELIPPEDEGILFWELIFALRLVLEHGVELVE